MCLFFKKERIDILQIVYVVMTDAVFVTSLVYMCPAIDYNY